MSLPLPVSIQIKANGVDVSGSIDWTTVDLLLVLTKEVSTIKFNVNNPGASLPAGGTKYIPAAGDQIDFYETTNSGSGNVVSHLFGGTITEIETLSSSASFLIAQVTATDWSYTMNGKLVVQSYGGVDPSVIVQDIVNAYCPAGFDTTTYVQVAGYTIPSIKFNYEQPTACIEALANQIGWQWYVDADKKVHFFLAENNASPFPIDQTSGGLEWNSLDVDINLQNMKNSVFVIGGIQDKIITPSNAVDVYLGNGTQMVFGIQYAYTSSSISITLNGVTQSIGVANQVTNPSAYNVLYDSGNKVITFNVPPPNGAVVEVCGTAEIPIIGHALDSVSIAKYGEFQDAIFDAQIKSTQEAQQRALAEILLYGHAVYDVKFYTNTPGTRIGQNILFNSPMFGASNVPLVVKRVEGYGQTPNRLRYQVECVGSDNVTFVDIMAGILQQENATNTTADNTTLEVLLSILESLAATDTLSQPTAKTTRAYQWTSGAQPGVWNLSTWD